MPIAAVKVVWTDLKARGTEKATAPINAKMRRLVAAVSFVNENVRANLPRSGDKYINRERGCGLITLCMHLVFR
jgi:hypothetical protein